MPVYVLVVTHNPEGVAEKLRQLSENASTVTYQIKEDTWLGRRLITAQPDANGNEL